MRISKFPPSRYCDCVTAPVKFRGLCHVCFFNCLFICLFSQSHLMKRRSGLSLIKVRSFNKQPSCTRQAWIKNNAIKDQFLCYLYVKVGPASEQESCALIGYPRVQNVFSFVSTLIPHRRKKRNAYSLLNTSYNFVTKQYIFVQ